MNILKYTIVISCLMLSACHTKRNVELNQSASVTSQDLLPENPLQQKVITSSVNTTKDEMSTLYGNDMAFQYARFHDDGNYPEGSVLYLVTWKQQDDPRWFGGKIPHTIQSIEIVRFSKTNGNQDVPTYQLFIGNPIKEMKNPVNITTHIARITEQQMVVIP